MSIHLHEAVACQGEVVDELAFSQDATEEEVRAAQIILECLDWKKPVVLQEFRDRQRLGLTVPSVVYGDPDILHILHFNDVYNITPRTSKEPCGGVSRFIRLLKDLQVKYPGNWTLFSGDCFAPSLTSMITKGTHMVPLLNMMNIKAAVYGNHDFEFGVPKLEALAADTNFPWFMSNVFHSKTGEPLGAGVIKRTFLYGGRKIGMIGLVENDWIATLTTLEPEDVVYRDFVEEGRKLARELRADGAAYIIALTHSRMHHDMQLAEEVPEIDLILGGHDHFYQVERVGARVVVKSGCDFRDLTLLTIKFGKEGPPAVEWERFSIRSELPTDPDADAIVVQTEGHLAKKLNVVLGYTAVPLDSRVQTLRTSEVNVGNFVCDIMKEAMRCDIALVNSGTIRADDLLSPGPIQLRDLMNLLPQPCMINVVAITGEQILQMLENGVSQYPAHEGRFPQVSGVRFKFDGQAPSGHRVDASSVTVGGAPIELTKEYSLASTDYLLSGKDGYEVFKDLRRIVDEAHGTLLQNMLRNHFTMLKVVARTKGQSPLARAAKAFRHVIHKEEDDFSQIHPTVDGRIINTNPVPETAHES